MTVNEVIQQYRQSGNPIVQRWAGGSTASDSPLKNKYREFLDFRKTILPDTTRDERENLRNTISQYRRAMSMSRAIDPAESLRIQEETFKTEESTLSKVLYGMDYLRNFMAKNVIVPILGLQEELGKKETVTTSDILGGLGMEEGWTRTGLGFIGDVATDLTTYILPFARVAKMGTAIATKAGEKILLPKGMKYFAGLRQSVMAERGLTEDAIRAMGGGARAASDDITKAARERMGMAVDAGDASITPDMFYSRAAYLHVPMTKIYQKMFTWNVPESWIKKVGDIPIVEEMMGPAKHYLQRIAQPFTVAAFRAAGHFEAKVLKARDDAFAYAYTQIDLADAFVKGGKSIFPTKEAAKASMDAFEELGQALPRGTVAWDKYWKTVEKRPEFSAIAQKYAMAPDELLHSFKGHVKLGEKLKSIIKEAGGDVNEFAGFYVPHIAKLHGAFEIMDKGKLSQITFPYKREFNTLQEYRDYLVKEEFKTKLELNPFQAWGAALTAARRMKANKDYLGRLLDKGIVKRIPDPVTMNADEFIENFNYMQSSGELVGKLNNFQKYGTEIKNLSSRLADDFGGRPAVIQVGKNDFRLLDERGRWGQLTYNSEGAATKAYKKGKIRRAEELTGGAYTTKEFDGITYEGRQIDMQDFEDNLVRNVPGPLRQMAAQGWNYATQKFKYWATVGGGQMVFMSRNLLSDMSRTFYDNTIRTLNPKLHNDAMTILTGYDPLTRRKVDLTKKMYTNSLGEIVSGKDIADEFQKTGLQSFDLQRFDVKLFTNEISRQKGPPGLRQLRTYFNWLGKSNVYVENHSKMVNFIADWQKGLNFDKAAELTHEYLYNYKLLPKAVQTSLGFFPFGRWSYLNTIGMVKRFVDSPGKQAAFIRGMDTAGEIIPQALGAAGFTATPLTQREKESLPQFYQEDVAIPLYRAASGATGLLTSFDFLPISELNEMGLFQGWRGVAKTLGSRLHPTIKSLFELGFNKDLFMGGPVRGKYTDEQGKTHYPYRPDLPFAKIPIAGDIVGAMAGVEEMQPLGGGEIRYKADPERMKLINAITGGIFSRPISEIGKLVDLPPSVTALRMLTGTKVYEKDMPEMQVRKFKEYAARLNELFQGRRSKEKLMVR